MFYSARLKLTGWYLLIIMAISIAFSAFIYFGSTQELDRALRVQRYRIEHPQMNFLIVLRGSNPPVLPRPIDPQVIEESRARVLEGLIGVNAAILFVSSLAGYFLAGRTLEPIQKMLSEQDRFISNASHELRTPLTVLRSEIEVGLREKNLTLIEAKKLLTSNLEETKRLQDLSNNLLQLAQFQRQNGTFALSPVILSTLIKESVQKVEPLASKRNVKLETHIPDYTFMADAQGMISLFVILLDNAVKYSQKGKKVIISAKEKDDGILISVQDHGIGISSKDIPHIFDRFYRSENSYANKEVTGYGLGLSIAKSIVDLHNGSITVKSIVGKETAFSVWLPQGKVT